MFTQVKFLIVAMVIFSLTACGGTPQGSSTMAGSNPSASLATVNGENITEQEVMKKLEPMMKGIELEMYNMKKEAINQIVDEKLLETAAKKESKTPEKYIEEYVSKNQSEPTEEDIKRYYEFKKGQMGDKKLEEVKDAIVDFLKNNQKNALKNKLMNELRTAANVKINIEPPRVDVKIGDGPVKGPKDAKVTVIEYSDYQCPFCGRARATVNQILETYPKDVRYSFKDFPLSFHKNAQKAHEAARCAGDQEKYWEMNKLLFENQSALEIKDLKSYAQKVGLNAGKFNECLDSGKFEKAVKESAQEGQRVGVSGTPAFFINGVMLSGARPFSNFKEIIDSEISNNK